MADRLMIVYAGAPGGRGSKKQKSECRKCDPTGRRGMRDLDSPLSNLGARVFRPCFHASLGRLVLCNQRRVPLDFPFWVSVLERFSSTFVFGGEFSGIPVGSPFLLTLRACHLFARTSSQAHRRHTSVSIANMDA